MILNANYEMVERNDSQCFVMLKCFKRFMMNVWKQNAIFNWSAIPSLFLTLYQTLAQEIQAVQLDPLKAHFRIFD